MKRVLALLVAVLMLATIFVGCGGSNGTSTNGGSASGDLFYGEDNVSLKVWAPDAAVSLVTKQCNDFIAQYPDKKIAIEVVAQGESDAATQLLNDPDAAADVFGFACDQLNKLTDAGVIFPVYDDYLADVQSRNSTESLAAATLKDTLYAFPETGDNGYYLVYDKRVVSDEQAKTLEGVLEACKAAGQKFVMDAGNGFYACMFPFTGGLEIAGLSDDGTQQFNQYDEDKIVDTLEAFAKLFHDYAGTFESAEVSKVSSGMAENPSTVAAGIDGSWNAKTVESVLGENYGAAKLPTISVNGQAQQIISMHGYKLIGVNAYSKFPATSQLLANYLTDEACQQQRAEELSWGPSNKTAAQSSAVTSNVAVMAILEQSEFSIPQVNLASTFWDPMANLGNNLYKDDAAYDKATLKTLFEKTISNIKDE